MTTTCERSILVDDHGRPQTYLRVSVTDRCNFRCVYCMPKEGANLAPRDQIFSFEEIVRVIHIFSNLGITKVRFTGGEPLVRNDFVQLVKRVNQLPAIHAIGVTTNGLYLQRYARGLKQAGVSLLNISLDSIDPVRFEQISGTNRLEDVLVGIHAALDLGFKKLKINTVVIRGVNDDEVFNIIDYFKDEPIDLRFIEYMPFLKNQWDESRVIKSAEILKRVRTKYSLEKISDPTPSVAVMNKIQGQQLRIGFISTMSEHFCNDCNRLRLTAEGGIKTCLFKAPEFNIRQLLRSTNDDDKIRDAICSVTKLKSLTRPDNVNQISTTPMVKIGG